MLLTIHSTVKLNSGFDMPLLGLGTFRAEGKETVNAVREALAVDYRHIDTAMMYRNEKEVGRAVRECGIDRANLFITTKLARDGQGYRETWQAVEASLENLGLDYVDLYLVHWPVESLMHETWKAMREIAHKGLSRSVGVSNFTIRLLEELKTESDLIPAVNQVEFHPFLYQKELLAYCRKAGIQLEAYSPLTRGRRLDDHRLFEIAEKHHKTTAQILLRWNLEHGVVTIPKSVTPSRIRENAALYDFALDQEDMAVLNDMDENLRFIHPDWAPREWGS
jgi:diketogulonate reductase-like aldo/keto reductase